MGLAPPSSVSDWIYTLSCVSLQATKKPAHRQAGFCRTGRYTPCTDSLSRPIVGHTPRKLPPFGAISRIIATASLTDAPLSYNTQPCVSRGFEKNFGGFPGICRGCFVNFPKKQDEVPPKGPHSSGSVPLCSAHRELSVSCRKAPRSARLPSS